MSEIFPKIQINLDAVKQNAKVVCDLCGKFGINVAGVIKFSDGDIRAAKAYLDGGCAQVAVSRAVHLKALKEAFPEKETLLTRSPMRWELPNVARYADFSLHSDADSLRALNDEAKKAGTKPKIILMLDVGDLREGVESIDELVLLALLVENELKNLYLSGIGTNHACLNGVLPNSENLAFLTEGAKAVEKAIGRKLDIISGGSSVNLMLLKDGTNPMPPEINHLRIGGIIANPINMRLIRDLTFAGFREDSVKISAEIVEIREKESSPKNSSGLNWSGEKIERENKGRRIRAILAIGSQDIATPMALMPEDDKIEIIGASSDHTIIDVTDSKRKWQSGDIVTFKTRYQPMLHSFTGQHVKKEYIYDK